PAAGATRSRHRPRHPRHPCSRSQWFQAAALSARPMAGRWCRTRRPAETARSAAPGGRDIWPARTPNVATALPPKAPPLQFREIHVVGSWPLPGPKRLVEVASRLLATLFRCIGLAVLSSSHVAAEIGTARICPLRRVYGVDVRRPASAHVLSGKSPH